MIARFGGSSNNNVDVVDPHNALYNCDLPDLPYGWSGMSAKGIINDKYVLLCGGSGGGGTNDCMLLGHENPPSYSTWTTFKLNLGRDKSAGFVVGDKVNKKVRSVYLQ